MLKNPDLYQKIAEFEPEGDDYWLPLDELLQAVFQQEKPQLYFPAIFNLFERFPDEDGAGVFWAALHGMEAVGGYETELVRYFRRSPALMIHALLVRLRNSGHTHVAGVALDSLLGAP